MKNLAPLLWLHRSCRPSVNIPPNFRQRLIRAGWLPAPGLGVVLSVIALSAGAALQPFSDDFNDGNDSGWTHYDPLSGLFGAPWAHYGFPSGAYRIQADASLAPAQAGPARGAGLRSADTFTDFYVAVDLVDWNTNLDQAVGLLARVSTPGLGTTTGYAFTYQEGDHDFSIALITGEEGNDISGSSKPLTLYPTNQYRLVFIGSGAQLEGRVYQLPDTRTPIAITTALDGTYPSGINGLLVYDNSPGGDGTAEATFDNYFAFDVEIPVLTIEPQIFGDLEVSWQTNATGFLLQTSPVVVSQNWETISPGAFITRGDRYVFLTSSLEGNMFFRLIRP